MICQQRRHGLHDVLGRITGIRNQGPCPRQLGFANAGRIGLIGAQCRDRLERGRGGLFRSLFGLQPIRSGREIVLALYVAVPSIIPAMRHVSVVQASDSNRRFQLLPTAGCLQPSEAILAIFSSRSGSWQVSAHPGNSGRADIFVVTDSFCRSRIARVKARIFDCSPLRRRRTLPEIS
jgi:hypothetical protein